MQNSLLNTVQKMREEKINVEELEIVLNSDIEEVVKLCKKACLKPKVDSTGNAYFTKDDVNMLKKIKELYTQTQEIQDNKITQNNIKQQMPVKNEDMLQKKIDFLTKAKNRIKTESIAKLSSAATNVSLNLQSKLDSFEKNILTKMGEMLSEKMDGFDEIIVELIRAKTENENLRQQVNSLNKQMYILKNELASFNPVAFGFYTKSEVNDI